MLEIYLTLIPYIWLLGYLCLVIDPIKSEKRTNEYITLCIVGSFIAPIGILMLLTVLLCNCLALFAIKAGQWIQTAG